MVTYTAQHQAEGQTLAPPDMGSGTVFRMTTNGIFTMLAAFHWPDAFRPIGYVVQGPDGNVYGTTFWGGYLDPEGQYRGGVFRLVPTPLVTGISASNGAVALTWSSFTNGVYRVEYKPALTATNWTALVPDVTATSASSSLTDSPAGDSERYYRVVLLP